MTRREGYARLALIIKKVRKHPTFQEILDYLALESEIQGYNFRVSKRTFQRDLEDIRSLYGIDIQYDFSRGVYFVEMEEQPDVHGRILEAFDTLNALNLSDRLSTQIHFEKRKPLGTENLYGLLHAITNRLRIEFIHQKFWEDFSTIRTVEPYALKEFKNRWYLVAKDQKDDKIKTFGLDRLSSLTITKTKFTRPETFTIDNYFEHCFGIITPDKGEPQEVILSFLPQQGKYIKTMPLHESQEILVDDEKEVRVSLKLFLSYDFLLEILSHGDNVKVISPAIFVEQVTSKLRNALNRYSK